MYDLLDYGTGKGFGFLNQEWNSKKASRDRGHATKKNTFDHRLAKLVRTALN